MASRCTKSDIERFWSNTRREGSCIVWAGPRLKSGYGLFVLRGKHHRAHRWIYQRVFGRLPKCKGALHDCDNKPCVALQHLYAGTQKQNIADAIRRGRMNTATRFTVDKIDDMRLLYEHGESQNSIARYFKTDQGTVSAIVTGKSRAVSGDLPIRELRAVFKRFGFEVEHVLNVGPL